MNEVINILFYLFIIISPFFDGLYFERDFIPSCIILFILLILELVNLKIVSKKKEKELDNEKDDENKEEKIKERNNKGNKINKLIRRMIIMSLVIICASLLTYILDYTIYHLDFNLTLIFYGTMQILEMCLLSILCVLKTKKYIYEKTGTLEKEYRTQNAAMLLSTFFMGCLIFIKTFYREGRFEGTFYYANSTAMFFLFGLIIALCTKTCRKSSKIFKILIILLCITSIILTNSRFTYLISLFGLFILLLYKLIIKHKEKKELNEEDKKINYKNIFKLKNIFIILFFIIAIALSLHYLLNSEKILNRFKTSTITRDINLRLSYLDEANDIIKDYPVGLGYEGYLNHQLIKENKYKLRLVHNMPYQIVLNYGFIMLIVAIYYFIRYIMICIKNKKLISYENLILLLLLMHSMIDIGTSFLALNNIVIILITRNLIDEK